MHEPQPYPASAQNRNSPYPFPKKSFKIILENWWKIITVYLINELYFSHPTITSEYIKSEDKNEMFIKKKRKDKKIKKSLFFVMKTFVKNINLKADTSG